jgi:hypothetical protein
MQTNSKVALFVVCPPLIGCGVYFVSGHIESSEYVRTFLYIASAPLVWWPFSVFLRRKTFLGGLIGIHTLMAWFILCMSMRWGDDLGWILYIPYTLVGLVVGVIVSLFVKEANQLPDPTSPSVTPAAGAAGAPSVAADH